MRSYMKRFELADTASNVLVLSAVLVAILPFLLGDRMGLIAADAFRQSTIMLNELSIYLTRALS